MVSVKRSRPSSPASVKVSQSDEDNPPENSKVTLPGPVSEEVRGLGGVGSFLERCGFCKKKMQQSAEVYMYGYLGAFCSPECRRRKMTYDRLAELVRKVREKKERADRGGATDVQIYAQTGQSTPQFHI